MVFAILLCYYRWLLFWSDEETDISLDWKSKFNYNRWLGVCCFSAQACDEHDRAVVDVFVRFSSNFNLILK